MSQPNDGAPMVVDSRWLGVGGTSRVCSQLLEGIAQLKLDTKVALWGKPSDYMPDAQVFRSQANPLSVRALLRESSLPAASRYVFPHVLRPLQAKNATVMVLDAIPLHVGSRARRQIWQQIFKRSVGTAARLTTISVCSRDYLADDLGIDPHRFTVVDLPLDSVFIEKLRAVRYAHTSKAETHTPYIVYFGQFNEHKNLKRLVRAFAHTKFAALGGELHIVGGSNDAVVALQRFAQELPRSAVHISGKLDEASLVAKVAGARAVAFVSLEEGLGLPPVEAVLAGIPVATSDRAWSHEALPVAVPRCDPNNEESIQAALDAAVEIDDAQMKPLTDGLAAHRNGMTPEHFAHQVLG